jgi:hypothetical protein
MAGFSVGSKKTFQGKRPLVQAVVVVCKQKIVAGP